MNRSPVVLITGIGRAAVIRYGRAWAALHQSGDLMPVEVVGIDLGQRPGDAETLEL
jgi:hypothetical protein